jgi:Zn finger protein HypA/HybF involved in hydrogenase expression
LEIAASILESVQLAARRNPGVRITKVGVKIGELEEVDIDALQFGFECLVKDTDWGTTPAGSGISPARATMSQV